MPIFNFTLLEQIQEDILENVSDVKVYTIRTIVICTLLASLLAGSYMIYQNFKAFGEHKKAGATIIISVLTMLALMATSFSPVLERIPGIFYSIFITLGASVLSKKYQGDLIFKHINAAGRIHSSGSAVLVCVISILILAGIILGAYFMEDAALAGS